MSTRKRTQRASTRTSPASSKKRATYSKSASSPSSSSSSSSSTTCDLDDIAPIPAAQFPHPDKIAEYVHHQGQLGKKQRAPNGYETFEELVTNPDTVFRDFTKLFREIRIMEPDTMSLRALVRGKGWGKSTFGAAWLAYLRREERLFAGSKVAYQMRSVPLIGVYLDLSQCRSFASIVARLAADIQYGIAVSNTGVPWQNPLPPEMDADSNMNSMATMIVQLFESIGEYSMTTNLKFALLVDNYDAPLLSCLTSTTADEEYLQFLAFYANFFKTLQFCSGTIPFQLLVGTTAFRNFFKEGQAHVDMSLESQLAGLLGYTWQHIEKHFATQLHWLQQLHELSREELKIKMEEWYGRHRWSNISTFEVFNPSSIHQFITNGVFKQYCHDSGVPARLLDSNFLMRVLVQAITSPYNSPPRLGTRQEQLRLPFLKGTQIPSDVQLALLHGVGLVSVHPKYDHETCSPDSPIELTVPNFDARACLAQILDTALVLPLNSDKVGALLVRHDLKNLLEMMCVTGAFEKFLDKMPAPWLHRPYEKLSMAFAAALATKVPFHIDQQMMCSIVTETGSEETTFQRANVDHVIHIDQTKSSLIIKFEIQSSLPIKIQKERLNSAIQQCHDCAALAKLGYTPVLFLVLLDPTPEEPFKFEVVYSAVLK